jgi:Tol biopolymer transport system component
VWDEHGRFSPNGEKIIFMSAYPYRSDPKASRVLTIRTEFMLMNNDGSNLTQLTHFRSKGYSESDKGGIAANPEWHPDGRSAALRTLFFPDYVDWTITFQGACGGTALQRQ